MSILDSLLVLLSIAVMYYLGIIVHELGHLASGWAVGFKLLSLKIGQWKPIWQNRHGDFEIKIGRFPFGGLAGGIARDRKAFRLKCFIFSAAGPVATGLFVLLLVKLADALDQSDYQSLQSAAVAGFMMQGLILLQNLWPHDVRLDGKKYRSDGAQMWESIFMKHAELENRYLAHALHHARFEARAGRTERAVQLIEEGLQGIENRELIFIRSFQIGFLASQGFPEAADALWGQALEAAEKDEPSASTKWLDALASIPVFWDAPALVPKALPAIERAIARAPQEITLHGTHGSLLILSGATDAGMRTLQHVKQTSEAESDQAISSYFLALGTDQLGQHEQARELYAEASRLYPACTVAEKIRTLINSKPGTVQQPFVDSSSSEKTLRELEEMAPSARLSFHS